MATENQIRPRVEEAGRLFLGETLNHQVTGDDGVKRSRVDGDLSYKTVAQTMGITEGRAGVYVREYLTQTDQLDKAPRPGRRNPNGAPVNEFVAMAEAAVEQYTDQIARLETARDEAAEAVAAFDADAWMADAATDLENEIIALQLQLTKWVNNEEDIATKSAASFSSDLVKRAKTLADEAKPKIDNLTLQKAKAEVGLEAIRAMDAAMNTPAEAPATE